MRRISTALLATTLLATPLTLALPSQAAPPSKTAPISAKGSTLQVPSQPDSTVVKKKLNLTFSPVSMIQVNGDLWVSGGNKITILSASGALKSTVPDLNNIGAMLRDGTTIYAPNTTGTEIYRIRISDTALLSSIKTEGCPSSLAHTGTFLYYGYGCSWDTVGVTGVDLSQPSTFDATSGRPKLSDTPSGVPTLAASGSSNLVVARVGIPPTVRSYSVGSDGTLTEAALASNITTMYDMQMSPDGSKLAITDYDHYGYNITEYNSSDLTSPTLHQANPYPYTLAYSPTGSYLAGGMGNGYGPGVLVWDAAGNLTSHANGNSTTAAPAPIAHTMTFSPDDKLIHMIVADGTGYTLVTTTTTAPTQISTTLQVPPPTKPGIRVPVKVTTSTPNTRFDYKIYGLTGNTLYSGLYTTDAFGKATINTYLYYSGSIRVSTPATWERTASGSTVKYKIARVLSSKLIKQSKITKGVYYYKKTSQVRLINTVLPKTKAPLGLTIQYKYKGVWYDYVQQNLTTNSQGLMEIYLVGNWPKNVLFRFVMTSPADNNNSAAKTQISPAWMIK